jgi:hypothetical protein
VDAQPGAIVNGDGGEVRGAGEMRDQHIPCPSLAMIRSGLSRACRSISRLTSNQNTEIRGISVKEHQSWG